MTLKSTEWDQYQTIYKQGAYDLWLLGWFPDYPDADDYLSPFLVDGGFFQNGYKNPKANKLVAKEQGSYRPGQAAADLRAAPGHRGEGRAVHPVVGRPEHRGRTARG